MKVFFFRVILFGFLSLSLSAQSLTSPSGLSARSRATYQSSLNQYGITWTFDKAYPSGQFANGDFWVVGPIKIVGISPSPTVLAGGRVMNGSMLNPTVNNWQGYDNKMFGTDFNAQYDQTLNAAMPGGLPLSPINPLSISQSASLISGISTETLGSGISNQVRTMAVLTVLSAVPPANSFRPPYVGSDKTVRFQLSNVNFALLPSLTRAANAPAIAEVASRFQRPWVEHMVGWIKECFLPRDNMHNYGREVASDVSDAALSLLLNYSASDKEPLAVRMVQLGIDYYAIINNGQGRINWRADGGHMSGRAFPILLAGYLLNDAGMKAAMSKSGEYAYQNGYYEGKLPPDYVHFGEIDQTFYVTQRDYERTNGINSQLYGNWEPDTRAVLEPYQQSDIGVAEWGVEHVHTPGGDNRTWHLPYRGVAGMSWSGYILASRALGFRNLWNHQALFDYMDRYMTIMQGNPDRTHNAFQAAMWDSFRPVY